MIRLAFFDFSKTIAADSGFGAGPYLVGRKKEYDLLYEEFVSNKISEISFIKSVIKLWKGVREEDLPKIYSKIEINQNAKEILKQLKSMNIKLALVSFIPTKLAELYKTFGFDYLSGTECEIINGVFTGEVLKINHDKGIITKNISNILKIGMDECIAVGDSRGDIKMFKSVGYKNSFAYNAAEEAKKYAKYHIKNFKEIMHIIENDNKIKDI